MLNMNRILRISLLLEYLLPWVVLLILLMYTYVELIYAPYLGFNFVPPTGEITAIFVTTDRLQEGDLLKQVGSVTWNSYLENIRQPLFEPTQANEIIPLQIERNQQRLTVLWPVPGPTTWDVLDRLVNLWWLAYLFWLAGLLTFISVRPKDTRWWLLIAFYFITALWLIAGNASRWRVWDSAVILRIAVWLSIPIYLHLHWVFPRSLGKLPSMIWGIGYSLAGILALLQSFQWLPNNAYLYGFLFAIIGSLALLIAHCWRQRTERYVMRFLLIAIGLAMMPAIVIGIAQLFQAPAWFGYAALLGLPLIPGAYFYIPYRHRLGGIELRTNRLIALYVYLILSGSVVTIGISLATYLPMFPGNTIFISIVISLASTVTTAFWFTPFQLLLEHHLLGITVPSTRLLESYAARITTTLALPHLVHVLRDEVLASLFVRQSALLRLDQDHALELIYSTAVEQEQLPTQREVTILLAEHGNYRVLSSGNSAQQSLPWVRVALPLWVSGKIIGLWLLGKRDPDDFYSSREITTFQAIADQTAIALVNIDQAQQLRALYQANVERHEMERMKLAHILHDEILQELAILFTSVEPNKVLPRFASTYELLITRIRQLITGLRPAMMDYSLHATLEEYVEDLSERVDSQTKVHIRLSITDYNYPESVKQALFRIVQQACENALRHAAAHSIRIVGELEPTHVKLVVEDDGIGFVIEEPLVLDRLLSDRHFGLVNMHERAALIDAELQIHSVLAQGTQVTII